MGDGMARGLVTSMTPDAFRDVELGAVLCPGPSPTIITIIMPYPGCLLPHSDLSKKHPTYQNSTSQDQHHQGITWTPEEQAPAPTNREHLHLHKHH